jgi:GNAT superfamily N-acetyltransferase
VIAAPQSEGAVRERMVGQDGRMTVEIDWYVGPRAELRPLFEFADDSQGQLDQYLELGRVLVALRAPVVLGHLQLVPTTRSGEVALKNMAVVPEQRGTGVGRALVVSAILRCGAEGFSRIVVATPRPCADGFRLSTSYPGRPVSRTWCATIRLAKSDVPHGMAYRASA